MACYISSRDNRFYAAVEQQFGEAPAISAANRFPATSLAIAHEVSYPKRHDKTGSRSFAGSITPLRTNTAFILKTHLISNPQPPVAPSYGALFESAMGGSPRPFTDGVVESIPASDQIRFVDPHGLLVGQGVSFGGELRFASSIVNDRTVQLNVPFSIAPAAGTPMGQTVSYSLTKNLKSLSVFDYWSPETALQRIVCGAVVDRMKISVNGDYHEMEFRGPASDLIDDASFAPGSGGLSSFPLEPAAAGSMGSPVPGHLGQAWIGVLPTQIFALTGASLLLDNNVEMRTREFGSTKPRCFAPGVRSVSFQFSIFSQDDAATKALYQAGRQASPVQIMLQLGQQPGQLMALYMKNVILSVPAFDDKETRLEWHLDGCLAKGTAEDELYLAFA
ncbi:MAG TPA: hypothetical protein VM120_28460 [Bryobacteraceae bacterium]|nr:hypothetical protein [Bryobacteraceae bacterium]